MGIQIEIMSHYRLPARPERTREALKVFFPTQAAILLERLENVRSLADRALVAGRGAPWEETGRMIARFHRAGLDHADLNAHNILFQGSVSDDDLRGWMIDFDRSHVRIPATGWRNANLERLQRSLRKRRGSRSVAQVDAVAGQLGPQAGPALAQPLQGLLVNVFGHLAARVVAEGVGKEQFSVVRLGLDEQDVGVGVEPLVVLEAQRHARVDQGAEGLAHHGRQPAFDQRGNARAQPPLGA